MRTRRALAAALVATVALSLAGCAALREIEGHDPDREIYPVTVTLDDGREVLCIVYDGYKSGGLSCDWSTVVIAKLEEYAPADDENGSKW